MNRIVSSLSFTVPFFISCVLSCQIKTGPEPSPSGGIPIHRVPEISVPEGGIILYPSSSGIPSFVPFTVAGLENEGEIRVEAESVSVALSFERTTGEGLLTLAASDGFGGSAEIGIEASNGNRSCRVCIQATEARMKAELEAFSIGWRGSSLEVPISTNVGYRVSCTASWISVSLPFENGVSCAVRENTGSGQRSAKLIISDELDALHDTVMVVQAARDHMEEAAGERRALERIFEALHGEDWTDSENWCTDAPLKTWHGVMTNSFKGEEHVVYLHLQYLGAHGLLPPEIGELKYLRELWIIGDEGIMGCIPSSFANLSDIRDITISGTSVSGPIPSCLSSLKKLEILGLDGNCLEGNLPLFLASLPALYNFGFAQNCLDGQVDASLLETRWWNTIDAATGKKMGEENLLRGQKEGHELWL